MTSVARPPPASSPTPSSPRCSRRGTDGCHRSPGAFTAARAFSCPKLPVEGTRARGHPELAALRTQGVREWGAAKREAARVRRAQSPVLQAWAPAAPMALKRPLPWESAPSPPPRPEPSPHRPPTNRGHGHSDRHNGGSAGRRRRSTNPASPLRRRRHPSLAPGSSTPRTGWERGWFSPPHGWRPLQPARHLPPWAPPRFWPNAHPATRPLPAKPPQAQHTPAAPRPTQPTSTSCSWCAPNHGVTAVPRHDIGARRS